MSKTVTAFIVGATATPARRKKAALREAGSMVADSPSQSGETLRDQL